MERIIGGLVAVTLVSIVFAGSSASYKQYHDNQTRREQAAQAEHAVQVAVATVSPGESCSANGRLAYDGAGKLAFCQQGTWQESVPHMAEFASPGVTAQHILDAAQHISGALAVYASDHDGRYPDRLSDLLVDKLVSNDDIYSDSFELVKSEAGQYSLRAQMHDVKACLAVDKASGVASVNLDSPFALSLQNQHAPYSCVGTAEAQQFTFDL